MVKDSFFRIGTMALHLLLVALLGACSKEEPATPDGPAVHGLLKGKASVNRIAFATPSSQGATYTFTVTSACDCAHGTLLSSSTVPNENNILEQSATALYCRGTSSGSGYCVLARGANASTPGPQYYIKPSNGGRVLAVRVKGGGTIPTSHDWFTYNSTSNTWSPDAEASGYFVWSVLSSQPNNCCIGG